MPSESEWCECGALKGEKAKMCKACRSLDGTTEEQMAIVMAFYANGPMTISELATETGLKYQTIASAIRTLCRKGRAVASVDDAGAGHARLYRLGPA